MYLTRMELNTKIWIPYAFLSSGKDPWIVESGFWEKESEIYGDLSIWEIDYIC